MNGLEELERDADCLVERKNTQRIKLDQYLKELKTCAETYIPAYDKTFLNKWNRVKVSLNAILCSFDEFECVWTEAREVKESTEIQILPIDANLVIELTKNVGIEIATQTEVENTVPNASVIDWRSVIADHENALTSLKSEIMNDSDFEMREEMPLEHTRKLSLETITSTCTSGHGSSVSSGRNTPQTDEATEDLAKKSDNSNNSNNSEEKEPEPEQTQTEVENSPKTDKQPRRSTRAGRQTKSFSGKKKETRSKPLNVKGSTSLTKYKRRSSDNREESKNKDAPVVPRKKTKNLMETIDKIRNTKDNIYVTTVGSFVEDKAAQVATIPPKPQELSFESIVMQNTIDFYNENF